MAAKAMLVQVAQRTRLYRPAKALYRRWQHGRRVRRRRRLLELRRDQRFRFYGEFVGPGDLCFDIGANFGNRVEVFLSLGARVVAVEPQSVCVDYLTERFGENPQLEIVPCGVADSEGSRAFHISEATETSTFSPVFIERTLASGRLSKPWGDGVETEVTTLDHLVARFGRPDYCKIDTEGYDAHVLEGLGQPIPCVSFEFIGELGEVASRCITRLEQLATFQYNFSEGESMQWALDQWIDGPSMRAFLDRLPAGSDKGDVFARLCARV